MEKFLKTTGEVAVALKGGSEPVLICNCHSQSQTQELI